MCGGNCAVLMMQVGYVYDNTIYYCARYYDPTIGRFLSEDPIRFWGGIDFYKYVENDPADAVDPSGTSGSGSNGVWNPHKPPHRGPLPGGGFIAHGFWCGPNWTGGRNEQYDPSHAGSYEGPVDEIDWVCMHHDKCYNYCRTRFKCDKGRRTECMRDHCDRNLIDTMPQTAEGQDIAAGILYGNNHPDAGSDASCGCQGPQ